MIINILSLPYQIKQSIFVTVLKNHSFKKIKYKIMENSNDTYKLILVLNLVAFLIAYIGQLIF